nr:hypothetical protein [Tanacetum cinerariifolium]
MLDHQDKYMMKAQVHVSRSFAISNVQPLPQRKLYCQIYQVVKHMWRGRLLASIQDHEHEGGDSRSQGGIKDNDIKIKIQDHSMQMNSQEQGSKIQERFSLDFVKSRERYDSFPGFNQRFVKYLGSESRPPMLNKENYVPWSSRLLWYAMSRPNGKLIYNSILNGPYVRKMIPEPGDANREITVTETFHLQTDDELSDKELKQIEADDQAIQTILFGLLEDIYAAVDSCETA